MPAKVSITIPCRNEERYIGRCLDSIINCRYDKNHLAVFVCDGLSDDGTIGIINKYTAKHDFIHLLENKERTTPFALNLGLRQPGYDVRIILGAHAEIYPDYIDEIMKVLDSDPSVGCVGGILENAYENEISSIIGKSMSSPFGVGNAHFRTGGKKGYVDTVAFGAYRKEVFEKIGYFDERLVRNQDDEFNYRVLKGGFRIYLSPGIRSKYYVRASLKKLYRQYYQYGYWKVFVNRKHKAVTTVRQLIPALFVLYLAAAVMLTILFPGWAPLFLSGLVLYLAGAIYSAAKLEQRIGSIMKIIQTFVILHFSYGLGYLEGVFQFLILGRNPRGSSKALTR